MSDDFDGVILGAGHNGLILQAYLGRAGLRTVCLERRDVAGGGLATVEDPRLPGFHHNTHSFFHRGIRQAPWYVDLGLERLGASYLEPELNVALVLADGGRSSGGPTSSAPRPPWPASAPGTPRP